MESIIQPKSAKNATLIIFTRISHGAIPDRQTTVVQMAADPAHKGRKLNAVMYSCTTVVDEPQLPTEPLFTVK